MKRLATAILVGASMLPAVALAEKWVRFEDTEHDFWDNDARLEVDLDSVRKVDVAKATDAKGQPLQGPFYVATRRAVLSDDSRRSIGYDSEITSEYYRCGGETLRTVNGSVLSVEVKGDQQKVKYKGDPGEAYAFGAALTGWQKHLQQLVCERAKAIES
jgi:hypothetical protein